MSVTEIKNEIQRIINDKNLKEQQLFRLIELCDSVKDDCKALNLLDTVGKKTDEAIAEFKKLLTEYHITVDSPVERQLEFWKKIERLWNGIDMWRLDFINKNEL